MDTLRLAVEALIRLAQDVILAGAVLVPPDDLFEVTATPSLMIQGPTIGENRNRRSEAHRVARDLASLTYRRCKTPRFYHLDFELVLTAADTATLLDFQEKVARFFQQHPSIHIEDRGSLNLTELTPMGGLKRVNLSDLRQSAGRCRIEDCPVFDGMIQSGPLIRDRRFEFRGDVHENRGYAGT